MKKIKFVAQPILVVLVSLCLACTNQPSGSEKGIVLADQTTVAQSISPGDTAPAFTKKDKDGNTVSLSDYAGKYVLISFWGTWCKPCRASHPHLVGLYNKYSKLGLAFINIANEGGKDARAKWLRAIEDDGLVWTQILNTEGIDECNVLTLYNIESYPTKILIDPQGKIAAKWIGSTREMDEKLIEVFGS